MNMRHLVIGELTPIKESACCCGGGLLNFANNSVGVRSMAPILGV